MSTYTSKDLIDQGIKGDKHFREYLALANVEGIEAVHALIESRKSKPLTRDINPTIEVFAIENFEKSLESMQHIVARDMSVIGAALMPDNCPAGPVGTIPVGGVVACKDHIVPEYHSADVCCSVMMSVIGNIKPRLVLDAAQSITHFGPGGRADDRLFAAPSHILARFSENPFLSGLETVGHTHFGTQGDGNHFLFVGYLESTGEVAIVTHHGSRKPGAELYKRGKTRAALNLSNVGSLNVNTEDGENYWRALGIIKDWTHASHLILHDTIARTLNTRLRGVLWNPHNFVFNRGDDIYYHAKGATPAWDEYGTTLIPLNMAAPVLLTRGLDNKGALGFAPHGAGRNYSRTEHLRRGVLDDDLSAIDARFYSGEADPSEYPSAYKDAQEIINQIDHFRLAQVVDKVLPYGCIMAGKWRR